MLVTMLELRVFTLKFSCAISFKIGACFKGQPLNKTMTKIF